MAMIETFGQRLRRIRKEQELTQVELAERTGLIQNQIGYYERDVNEPTVSRIEWLCKALDMTASELLGF
jgi:transcriptional regulator with XRE-family HTH domain